MKTIFLDSSLLLAACSSRIGASYLILGYCRKKKVQGYISEYVLAEVKRNSAKKLSQTGKQTLNVFLQQANLLIVSEPSEQDIVRCSQVVAHKDAPILAAAMNNRTEYLLTTDKKDFIQPRVRSFVQPLKIITPGDFVKNHLS